jgi:acyl-CoA thioester hydrolase
MDTPRSATVRLTIPFCDVDGIRMVWHGNYLKYFDAARDRLFLDAGLDLYRTMDETGIIFPITRTSTKHIRPLHFRDEVDCKAVLVEAEYRLVLDFEMRLATTGVLCTKGRTEQVAVRLADGILELRLPENVRQALGRARDGG